MTQATPIRHVTLALLFLIVVLSRDVHAYLDPGTGSLIFQTTVAALAAAAYAFRSYWGKIRGLFSRKTMTSSRDRTDLS